MKNTIEQLRGLALECAIFLWICGLNCLMAIAESLALFRLYRQSAWVLSRVQRSKRRLKRVLDGDVK